tara:strand:- start:125 stop:670 length:546 start_codon:yes stop_codon:yes gene_type:complete
MNTNYIQTLEDLVRKTWSRSKPEYFISLLWTDYPRKFETAQGHMNILKNKLLCYIHNLNKCIDIPDANHRVGMTVFHEKGSTIMPLTLQELFCYHTHIHLFNVDTYLKDLTDDRLRKLIQRKIGRTIRKLNKEYNKSYKGVDVKVWEEHRHANYNFKDYEKYRGHQDEDLVLDLHNSDFLS